MATPEVALRKRQQIAKANRMMFIWVAAVSAVVGFAAVGAVLLWQKQAYNEKVLGEKSKTSKILEQNIVSIAELEDKVRVLNTNQALRDAMAEGNDKPIRVVLDALPSEPNSSALGASLQKKFLEEEGLTLETLIVEPIVGIELATEEGVEDAAAVEEEAVAAEEGEEVLDAQKVTFAFTVSASSNNVKALQDLLQRLERSIRPIDLTNIRIDNQGSRIEMIVEGHSYYRTATTAELKDKKVEIK